MSSKQEHRLYPSCSSCRVTVYYYPSLLHLLLLLPLPITTDSNPPPITVRKKDCEVQTETPKNDGNGNGNGNSLIHDVHYFLYSPILHITSSFGSSSSESTVNLPQVRVHVDDYQKSQRIWNCANKFWVLVKILICYRSRRVEGFVAIGVAARMVVLGVLVVFGGE